jgi:hypothetical protein
MGVFTPPASPLQAVNPNVNAPDFVQNFSTAINACTILIPTGVAQIGSFAFDYREVEETELEAEITDHWLEDNTAAQDHIALRPARVTLSGFVAELFLPASTLMTVLGVLSAATNALSAIPAYLGAQTVGNTQLIAQALTQAQNVVVQVEQAIARAAQLANLLGGLLNGPARNRQQSAYLQLKAYQQARIVFTVVTPWETLQNMVIESLHVVSPADSKDWSKFTVRLKQLQFVSTGEPTYVAALSSPVASAQGQAPTNVGATAGAVTDETVEDLVP